MDTVKNIRRRAKAFPVCDIVKISKISRRTIYAIISGENTNPKIETLSALSRAVTKLELQLGNSATRKFSRRLAKKTDCSDSPKGKV